MQKSKNHIMLKLLLLGLFLSYGGCSDKPQQEQEKVQTRTADSEVVSKPKPIEFEFPTSKGDMIKITFEDQRLKFNNFPNKIVLVDFFGNHCPPCLAEIPHLADIQKKYKKDFVILGIHVQKRMNVFDRANFIKSHGINYIVVDDDQSINFTQFIQQVVGWRGSIPFMMMFTPNGEMFTYYNGMVPQEMIEGDIKKLLDQYPKQNDK